MAWIAAASPKAATNSAIEPALPSVGAEAYSAMPSTKKIEYGDPFGNGDLQARNCIAYLAEVFFGWGILDLSAFAAVEDAVA